MKKSIAAWSAAFVFLTPALFAASSTADLSSSPARKEKFEIEVKNPGVAGRWVKSDANLYYVAQNKREGEVYKEFGGCVEYGCEKTPRSQRAEVRKVEAERKYNIANPFFQPMAMGASSVTDVSYTSQNIGFTILPGTGEWENPEGKYSAGVITVAEHLAFGVTDEFSIIASARYAKASLSVKWDTITDPDLKMFSEDTSDAGKVDAWGIGAQWRFLNSDDLIAYILGSYQSLPDAGMALVIGGKVGYKNDDSVIYGFANIYNYGWKNEGYGFGFTNQHDQTEFFYQKESGTSSVYYDLGIGVFSVLDEDWSVDVSGTYMDAEWHGQISVRAAVSYQPWKNAAISFYGRLALWDDADKFESKVAFLNNDRLQWDYKETAGFTSYNDISAGLMLTVSF
jgi:hypothetical protein